MSFRPVFIAVVIAFGLIVSAFLPIDFLYFDLWHYDGRTSKHGAFMGGADFGSDAFLVQGASVFSRIEVRID